MQKIKLSNQVSLSRMVHGHWRLQDWGMTDQQLLNFAQEAVGLGISSFDHADIYGNHTCEAAFGRALKLSPAFRNQIELVTKCGIMLTTDKFPQRQVKHYNYSAAHIINSAEQSLKNLNTDRIDVLLLHRPSPLFNAAEAAQAFDTLYQAGKVLSFGVSNFNPIQFELLNSMSNQKLVTNQIEISPYCLDHFYNNNLDYLQMKQVAPMAWSPLAGGKIFDTNNEKGNRVLQALQQVAAQLGQQNATTIAYAWLLMHPANIIPICGTGKLARLQEAVQAVDVQMSTEQWFIIYTAITGVAVP